MVSALARSVNAVLNFNKRWHAVHPLEATFVDSCPFGSGGPKKGGLQESARHIFGYQIC